MGASTWTQDAHDAQGSGYTPVDPTEPWTYAWQYNGADGSGGRGNHTYDAPREARPVLSTISMFVPAGLDATGVAAPNGLTCLNRSTGGVRWTALAGIDVQAAPVFDESTSTVLTAATNGLLYKHNVTSGALIASYNTGSAIRKAVRVVGAYAYVVCDDGTLHKVSIATMTRPAAWATAYASGSVAQTPASYSAAKGVWVYCTADLYVHGVNDSNGTRLWRVKPSPVTQANDTFGQPIYDWKYGIPAIADQHGYVIVRMRSVNDVNGSGYSVFARSGNTTPGTNSEIRATIQANPNSQSYFVLDLLTGAVPIVDGLPLVPAVVWGSTEDVGTAPGTAPHIARGVVGQWPVVKVWPNGDEVVYCGFRSFASAINTLGPTNVTGATWSAGTVTMTLAAVSPVPVGTLVTISGVTPAAYNGTVTLTSGSTGNVLKYALAANPGAYVSGGLARAQGVDDGRWAGSMGEMVLDSTTVPGLAAGDMRYVRFSRFVGYGNTGAYQGPSEATKMADEQSPLTMAGTSIFHSHWDADDGVQITDRSVGKGLVWNDPIVTTDHTTFIHGIKTAGNGTMNLATHKVASGANLTPQEEDASGRTWPQTSGFWAFWGVSRPPLGSGAPGVTGNPLGWYWNVWAFSRGFRPNYTIVSDDMIFHVGNGGEITAFTHVGAVNPTTIGSATPVSSSVTVYDKYEASFAVTGSPATDLYLPYATTVPTGVVGGTGISVDGQFLPPGQSDWALAIIQPCFRYMPYTKAQRAGITWLYPSADPSWMVRFAPTVAGSWTWRVRVTDANGTTYQSQTGFTATP